MNKIYKKIISLSDQNLNDAAKNSIKNNIKKLSELTIHDFLVSRAEYNIAELIIYNINGVKKVLKDRFGKIKKDFSLQN